MNEQPSAQPGGTELPPPPDVAGFSLDGTEPYVISAEENRRLCESLGTQPDPSGAAHPSYYYIGTQVGMGVTVAGLCAAADFDVNKGPMMAYSGAEFLRPMLVDTPYQVKGEIVSLTRKASRKLGFMDILEYRLRFVELSGETVVEVSNAWVLPRGGKA